MTQSAPTWPPRELGDAASWDVEMRDVAGCQEGSLGKEEKMPALALRGKNTSRFGGQICNMAGEANPVNLSHTSAQ